MSPLSTPPRTSVLTTPKRDPLEIVYVDAQEIGLTPVIRAFFFLLDTLLPTDFETLLDHPDVVFALEVDGKGTPTKVSAYRSSPVLGEHTLINVARDWAFAKKFWFRKRRVLKDKSPTGLRYELLVSYAEDYRPEFEVDFSLPLFSLDLHTR
jgi:hypothetical protein